MIINISASGNSGQPFAASKYASFLSSKGLISKNIYLNNQGLINRFRVIFYLFTLKLEEDRKYVIHLGLESLFPVIFRYYRNTIFVNHGIPYFSNKYSIYKCLYIILLRLGRLRGNRIGSVNSSQCKTFSGSFVFNNEINREGLPQLIENKRRLQIFGFVGGASGQKNNLVLMTVIERNEHVLFYHLSQSPIKQFQKFSNYVWLDAAERTAFFNKIDCILIPSLYESYCLVAYEAAYCGILVLHSGADALSSLPFGKTIVENCPIQWSREVEGLYDTEIEVFSYSQPASAYEANLLLVNMEER